MKEIYTPMERILIQGALLAEGGTVPRETANVCGDEVATYGTSAVPANEITEEQVKEVVQWFNTTKTTASLLELDELLLKLEEAQGTMDGIKMEDWLL